MGWADIPELSNFVTARLVQNAYHIMRLQGWRSSPADPDTDTGVAYQMNPERPIAETDLPAVYHMIGPTFQIAISNPGQVVAPRTYLQRWLFAPLKAGDAQNDGTVAWLKDSTGLIDKIRMYYEINQGLRVHDAGLDELHYSMGILQEAGTSPAILDNGVEAYGVIGGDYYGFTLSLPIIMSANASADYILS